MSENNPLISLTMLARRIGISVQLLKYYMNHYDPPKPEIIAKVKYYRRNDVMTWWKSMDCRRGNFVKLEKEYIYE